ncbi:hypothetical protein ACXYFN_00375 [Mycoplasma sp. 48589B]
MKSRLIKSLKESQTYLIVTLICLVITLILSLVMYSLNISTMIKLGLSTSNNITNSSGTETEIPTSNLITTGILGIFAFVTSIVMIVFAIKLATTSYKTYKMFNELLWETTTKVQLSQPDLVKLTALSNELNRLFIFNLIGIITGPVLLIVNVFFTRTAIRHLNEASSLLVDGGFASAPNSCNNDIKNLTR